jgi:DNA polymerase III epsilon subunit-like protein
VAHLHGALSDAVATAELFLAMVAEQGLQTRLGDWRAG